MRVIGTVAVALLWIVPFSGCGDDSTSSPTSVEPDAASETDVSVEPDSEAVIDAIEDVSPQDVKAEAETKPDEDAIEDVGPQDMTAEDASDSDTTMPDADAQTPCNNLDCDDEILCTADSCDPQSGACVHDQTGCWCITDDECDDGLECTEDKCDQVEPGLSGCSNVLNEDACLIEEVCFEHGDSNPDALCERCDAVDGDIWGWSDAPDGTLCGDGTGICQEGVCQAQDLCEGVVCDDDIDCTTNACDPLTGACVHDAVGCECFTDSDCWEGKPKNSNFGLIPPLCLFCAMGDG